MFKHEIIDINGFEYYTYVIGLPKTTLLIVGNDKGYFMCGALDVAVFDSKPHLLARKCVCGRAEGVKTIEQLIDGNLAVVSKACADYGISKGMKVRDALLLLS